MNISNEYFYLKFKDGMISEFYSKNFGLSSNLSLKDGTCGSACYTYKTDDITSEKCRNCTPYEDRTSIYDIVEQKDEYTVVSKDTKNGITTEFLLKGDGLIINSAATNENISEFGINLELNFLGRKGSIYKNQLLPTSPYTSSDNKCFYYILTNPKGKFMVVIAKTKCDGWKLDYSSECYGHYITNLKVLSSFDRAYNGSERKNIEIEIKTANSLEEAYLHISKSLKLPVCYPVLNGGFDGYGKVKVYGEYDYLSVKAPSGKVFCSDSNTILMPEFGFYTVTPVYNNTSGSDCMLWNGKNIVEMFNKSSDTPKEPYNNSDVNLCEGGCFLWEWLVNMNFNKSLKYDKLTKEHLNIIMAKKEFVPRKTIVPYAVDAHKPYHIYKSDRVQEQFFGVSILLEAYRLYKSEEIYEYMIATLLDLTTNYIKDGMIYNGRDYTTVCAPIIPIIDVALLLKEKNDERYQIFEKSAKDVATYLYERQYNFPTEGDISGKFDTEYEDGSISCTALSLLYYCKYIERNKEYEKFAFDVLKLHEAWTIYSPDAKMNLSSFRWWETIWEGDGEGPSICCGHAWAIWKGEALFYGGIFARDDKMILDSWNNYVTNFCKTHIDGTMYSCYEVDYIRGGGYAEVKRDLKQLSGEKRDVKFEVAHSYPTHVDNSLSRYAWVRAYYTWLKTAAVLNIDGEIIPINATVEGDVIKTDENITEIYINCDGLKPENKNIKIL